MNFEHTVMLPHSEHRPELAQGTLFFVGTATLLIRYAGFSLLTDPNFISQGETVHLGFRQGGARTTNPAIGFGALPALDFVLLSHLHEDHFDRVVTRKLAKNLPILLPPSAAKTLAKKRFQVLHPLKPWQALNIVKGNVQLKVTALPARHGPGLLGFMFPQVIGYMLEFQTLDEKTIYRIYISGDTSFNSAKMKRIARQFSPIDLAIFYLGGEKLYGLQTTMSGKQGVLALKALNAKETIPVHYNDYAFFQSPLEDFQREATKEKVTRRIRYLGRGDLYAFQIPAERR